MSVYSTQLSETIDINFTIGSEAKGNITVIVMYSNTATGTSKNSTAINIPGAVLCSQIQLFVTWESNNMHVWHKILYISTMLTFRYVPMWFWVEWKPMWWRYEQLLSLDYMPHSCTVSHQVYIKDSQLFDTAVQDQSYYELHNVAGLLLYIILCLIIPAVCTLPCLNGGTCSQPDTCTCVEGWSGSTCGKYFVSDIITMQPGLMLKDGNSLTSTKLRTRTINSMRAICYRSPKWMKKLDIRISCLFQLS